MSGRSDCNRARKALTATQSAPRKRKSKFFPFPNKFFQEPVCKLSDEEWERGTVSTLGTPLGLDKGRPRAVTQPYILTMQAASLLSMGTRGALDHNVFGQYMGFFLSVLAGVRFGVAAFNAPPSNAAMRVVMAVVTVSGFALLLS